MQLAVLPGCTAVGCTAPGQVSSAHAQLCRAVAGCATLNLKNPSLWRKLRHMISSSAASLNPNDIARCAWGLARARLETRKSNEPVFAALLARAAVVMHDCSFGRVPSLNLLWAVADARVLHLMPPGVLTELVWQSLGGRPQPALQQQQPRDGDLLEVEESSTSSNDTSGGSSTTPAAEMTAAGVSSSSSAAAALSQGSSTLRDQLNIQAPQLSTNISV